MGKMPRSPFQIQPQIFVYTVFNAWGKSPGAAGSSERELQGIGTREKQEQMSSKKSISSHTKKKPDLLPLPEPIQSFPVEGDWCNQ